MGGAEWRPPGRAAYCGVANFGNFSGAQEGRPIGEADPPLRKIWQKLRYYDAAYCARRITVPVFMDVGFIDQAVPPDSVYTIYNQLRGPKFMFDKIVHGHDGMPPLETAMLRAWRESVLK